ncbi:class I SAM-dependent methyltransferase [Tepidibacillus sp. HK-1]|uniref:tRNA (adenine(22)-N(1))-methyltransferase n=1 Tax=Tepidibacillus sp. HK-1 TaxID=1883407 RepID=UPI00085297D6|nr:class I SAM-dependent methyltransferase [Tepidibacillus sp. HK-1]GBF10161.1 tRNA (adenine(22)-N(1))-methyltransferase [Tepidibacillus sp. HK-1]
MESIQLSERLLMIAQNIPVGKRVADIGSDHALLPSYLIVNEISPFVIAGEVNEGPYQAAKRQIESLGLEDKVSVRKGNGLQVIEPNEVQVVTIAGMGGSLISQILEQGKEKIDQLERFILQPNVGADQVRRWLDQHNWDLIAEEILEEGEKIYEIIVAEKRRGMEDPVYRSEKWSKDELYRLGPILVKKQSEVLIKKWMIELTKVEYILEQIKNSKNEQEKSIKEMQLNHEQKWLKGVIQCLQKDKPLFS